MKMILLSKTVLTNTVGKSCMKEKKNIFDFGAREKENRKKKIIEFENVQVVGSGLDDYVHSVQPCGMVLDGREHSMRPDDNVQTGYEHRVHLHDMVLDGHDDVFVGHVGHLDDKGAGGGGGEGDGDCVGAVGLMCAKLDCNIDMRRNSFARTRSIETGRQGPRLSRTTTRTRSPSPWRRTRRATTRD